MKKSILKGVFYLLATFLLTALLVIIISLFGSERTIFGYLLLILCYQIPWLMVLLFEGKSFLKKELVWNKKDQRFLLLIFCFALVFYLIEGLLHNLSINGSKIGLGFLEAILFGSFAQLGWRGYFQDFLEAYLGKKDRFFIYFFIALIETVWYVLLMNLAWHMESLPFFVFFIYLCGHSFCMGWIKDLTKSSIPVVFYHFIFRCLSYFLVLQFHTFTSLFIAALQILIVFFLQKQFTKVD